MLQVLHAGDFDDGPVWGQVAGQPDNAAGRRQRIAHRPDHVLVVVEFHAFQVFGDGLAGHGHAVAVNVAAVQQGLHQHRHAAGFVHVLGHVLSARLEVGDVGRFLENLAHLQKVEVDSRFVGDRRQVQAAVGRPAGGGNDHGGVFQRLSGDDVARPDVLGQQRHHRLARRLGVFVPGFIDCGRAGGPGQRQADGLGHAGHGVGGELPAAGPGPRTGDAFQLMQFFVTHLAGAVLADALEDVDHGHVLVLEAAGKDGAAVHENAGHVEAHHGHHQARQRLVAAGDADHGVVTMAAHGQFHRIGDDFAADQRRFHALVAHGDAVGDGDGGEFPGRASGRIDAFLCRPGLALERDVARRGFVPTGDDADQGPVNLGFRQPHGVKERPVRRALRPLGHVTAGQPGFVEHLGVHGISSVLGRFVYRFIMV